MHSQGSATLHPWLFSTAPSGSKNTHDGFHAVSRLAEPEGQVSKSAGLSSSYGNMLLVESSLYTRYRGPLHEMAPYLFFRDDCAACGAGRTCPGRRGDDLACARCHQAAA